MRGFVAGYAESIQTVFIVAVPIAALAFLASWLIPQVELRKWSAPETLPAGESMADAQAARGGEAASSQGIGSGADLPGAGTPDPVRPG